MPLSIVQLTTINSHRPLQYMVNGIRTRVPLTHTTAFHHCPLPIHRVLLISRLDTQLEGHKVLVGIKLYHACSRSLIQHCSHKPRWCKLDRSLAERFSARQHICANNICYNFYAIVRPSVCPSHRWIGQNLLKLGLCNFRNTAEQLGNYLQFKKLSEESQTTAFTHLPCVNSSTKFKSERHGTTPACPINFHNFHNWNFLANHRGVLSIF